MGGEREGQVRRWGEREVEMGRERGRWRSGEREREVEMGRERGVEMGRERGRWGERATWRGGESEGRYMLVSSGDILFG